MHRLFQHFGDADQPLAGQKRPSGDPLEPFLVDVNMLAVFDIAGLDLFLPTDPCRVPCPFIDEAARGQEADQFLRRLLERFCRVGETQRAASRLDAVQLLKARALLDNDLVFLAKLALQVVDDAEKDGRVRKVDGSRRRLGLLQFYPAVDDLRATLDMVGSTAAPVGRNS